MIGRTIGNYRIDAKLGQGGMGAVYKGLDLMLERPVAIKALRADIAASPQHVERFRQEARTLARLLHPHIATLYALLREGDDLYMVMEFVEGETFEAVLHRERRIPVEHALRLFDQALRGIDHAHQRGIIHRDVKPANFMVMPSGTVKVMDFGIARLLGSTRMTQTRHAIGTAEYMAPEQVRAREVDARTDVYALGILLYEMVTGRVPFEAESSFETMQAHLQAEPRPPRVLTSDLPESVEAAILTALAKEPDDRHASVAAFRAALADVTPTGPPISLPVPLVEAPPSPETPPTTAAPKAPSGPAPETVIAPARSAEATPDDSPKITDELALDAPELEASADELAPPEPPTEEAEPTDLSDQPEDTSSTDDDPPTVPSPATRIAAPATVAATAVIPDPDTTAPATVLAPAAVAPTVVAPLAGTGDHDRAGPRPRPRSLGHRQLPEDPPTSCDSGHRSNAGDCGGALDAAPRPPLQAPTPPKHLSKPMTQAPKLELVEVASWPTRALLPAESPCLPGHRLPSIRRLLRSPRPGARPCKTLVPPSARPTVALRTHPPEPHPLSVKTRSNPSGVTLSPSNAASRSQSVPSPLRRGPAPHACWFGLSATCTSTDGGSRAAPTRPSQPTSSRGPTPCVPRIRSLAS